MGERYSVLRQSVGEEDIKCSTEDVFKLRLWEESDLTLGTKESFKRIGFSELREPVVLEGSYFIDEPIYYRVDLEPVGGGAVNYTIEMASREGIKTPSVMSGSTKELPGFRRCYLNEKIGELELKELLLARTLRCLTRYYCACGECTGKVERSDEIYDGITVVEKEVKLSDKVLREKQMRYTDARRGTKHEHHKSPRFHIRRLRDGRYVFVGKPNGELLVPVYSV